MSIDLNNVIRAWIRSEYPLDFYGKVIAYHKHHLIPDNLWNEYCTACVIQLNRDMIET